MAIHKWGTGDLLCFVFIYLAMAVFGMIFCLNFWKLYIIHNNIADLISIIMMGIITIYAIIMIFVQAERISVRIADQVRAENERYIPSESDLNKCIFKRYATCCINRENNDCRINGKCLWPRKDVKNE